MHQKPKKKNNHSVFDENTFFETATKNKIFDFFSIFFGSNFFVSWVPNQQNRSPTDKTVPSPPKNGHISGPRVTWDPKQGSLGPHIACDQIWWAGVAPRPAPKTGKLHFWAFLARVGPQTGSRNYPPRPPKTSKSRVSRKTRVEPPNVVRLRKLRTATAVQLSQKLPENSPVAPSYG